MANKHSYSKQIKREEYGNYCVLCDKYNIPRKYYHESWHSDYHRMRSDMRRGVTKNY